MTHTYQITGMTCTNCAAKIKSQLLKLPDVLSAEVDLSAGKAVIEMQRHIHTADLQKAISASGKYTITEDTAETSHQHNSAPAAWFQTYKPVILIFAYITSVTLVIQFVQGSFHFNEWMRHFMAGFFLIFSFFKLLDVPGFASSYSSYDIIAKRVYAYGYIYPFIELALGILYLIPSLGFWTNICTLVVMSVSLIGVLQALFSKKEIQCACLGAVFNLPMSTVTVIEDGLMIVMSAIGLFLS